MATYYKYAERDVNSQLDWSKIGKDITTMLYDQADMRRQKREAFDKQATELDQALEKYPTGDNLTLNEKYQNFASDGQEYRLQQDRLYKSGLLDPRDYRRNRQRFIDDTKNFFDIGKEAQDEYTEKYNRMKEGKSSFLEQDMMVMVEGLGNLQNLSPIINPATGGLNVARMVKGDDGVEFVDSNNLMSINEMRQRVKFKFDKFDKDKFVNDKASMLGSFITTEIIEASAGGGLNVVREIMDQTLRDDFDTYLDDSIEELMASPFNSASVLGDWMSDKYTPTTDFEASKKDDSLVYTPIDENGSVTVQLSEKQKEDVKGYMRDQITAKLDKEIKARTSQKSYDPTRSLWINRAFQKEDAEQQFALIASAMRGDKTAMQTLMTGYSGTGIAFDPDKKFMDVTINGVVKPISLEGDLRTSGANLAAALGLSSEEYNTWAEKNNIPVTTVDITKLTGEFKDVRGVEQVGQIISSSNVKALNSSLTMDFRGAEIDKQNVSDQAKSFARELQAIAAPLGIPTSVDIQGNVTIGGDVIPEGINQADKVLELLDKKYKSKPQQTRKTLAQIMEENPSLSREQAIAIFKQQ